MRGSHDGTLSDGPTKSTLMDSTATYCKDRDRVELNPVLFLELMRNRAVLSYSVHKRARCDDTDYDKYKTMQVEDLNTIRNRCCTFLMMSGTRSMGLG